MSAFIRFGFCLLALTVMAGPAAATPSFHFLKCQTDGKPPKGIAATFTSFTDLKVFQQWCEAAETEYLPVTMYPIGDGYVFESVGYGATGDLPPLEQRNRMARSPWSKLNNSRFDYGLSAEPGNQVRVTVDKSEQLMWVYIDDEKAFQWPVSTAREDKETPTGTFGVQSLSRDHKSSLYDMTPMPFSVFYDGHYAIHGTEAIHQIGTEASAGCVRLIPSDAALLFNMVQIVGQKNVNIEITQ